MLAEAQGNITGRVIDEQSQPIPFVNVVLLNRADSAFIKTMEHSPSRPTATTNY